MANHALGMALYLTVYNFLGYLNLAVVIPWYIGGDPASLS